jgi:hypothetical protein
MRSPLHGQASCVRLPGEDIGKSWNREGSRIRDCEFVLELTAMTLAAEEFREVKAQPRGGWPARSQTPLRGKGDDRAVAGDAITMVLNQE